MISFPSHVVFFSENKDLNDSKFQFVCISSIIEQSVVITHINRVLRFESAIKFVINLSALNRLKSEDGNLKCSLDSALGLIHIIAQISMALCKVSRNLPERTPQETFDSLFHPLLETISHEELALNKQTRIAIQPQLLNGVNNKLPQYSYTLSKEFLGHPEVADRGTKERKGGGAEADEMKCYFSSNNEEKKLDLDNCSDATTSNTDLDLKPTGTPLIHVKNLLSTQQIYLNIVNFESIVKLIATENRYFPSSGINLITYSDGIVDGVLSSLVVPFPHSREKGQYFAPISIDKSFINDIRFEPINFAAFQWLRHHGVQLLSRCYRGMNSLYLSPFGINNLTSFLNDATYSTKIQTLQPSSFSISTSIKLMPNASLSGPMIAWQTFVDAHRSFIHNVCLEFTNTSAPINCILSSIVAETDLVPKSRLDMRSVTTNSEKEIKLKQKKLTKKLSGGNFTSTIYEWEDLDMISVSSDNIEAIKNESASEEIAKKSKKPKTIMKTEIKVEANMEGKSSKYDYRLDNALEGSISNSTDLSYENPSNNTRTNTNSTIFSRTKLAPGKEDFLANQFVAPSVNDEGLLCRRTRKRARYAALLADSYSISQSRHRNEATFSGHQSANLSEFITNLDDPLFGSKTTPVENLSGLLQDPFAESEDLMFTSCELENEFIAVHDPELPSNGLLEYLRVKADQKAAIRHVNKMITIERPTKSKRESQSKSKQARQTEISCLESKLNMTIVTENDISADPLNEIFDHTALTVMGVLIEELVTDMIVDWSERCEHKIKSKKIYKKSFKVLGDLKRRQLSAPAYFIANTKRNVPSSLMSNRSSSSHQKSSVIEASSNNVPGPLILSDQALEIEAALQLKGAVLDQVDPTFLLSLLEALFGENLSEYEGKISTVLTKAIESQNSENLMRTRDYLHHVHSTLYPIASGKSKSTTLPSSQPLISAVYRRELENEKHISHCNIIGKRELDDEDLMNMPDYIRDFVETSLTKRSKK